MEPIGEVHREGGGVARGGKNVVERVPVLGEVGDDLTDRGRLILAPLGVLQGSQVQSPGRVPPPRIIEVDGFGLGPRRCGRVVVQASELVEVGEWGRCPRGLGRALVRTVGDLGPDPLGVGLGYPIRHGTIRVALGVGPVRVRGRIGIAGGADRTGVRGVGRCVRFGGRGLCPRCLGGGALAAWGRAGPGGSRTVTTLRGRGRPRHRGRSAREPVPGDRDVERVVAYLVRVGYVLRRPGVGRGDDARGPVDERRVPAVVLEPGHGRILHARGRSGGGVRTAGVLALGRPGRWLHRRVATVPSRDRNLGTRRHVRRWHRAHALVGVGYVSAPGRVGGVPEIGVFGLGGSRARVGVRLRLAALGPIAAPRGTRASPTSGATGSSGAARAPTTGRRLGVVGGAHGIRFHDRRGRGVHRRVGPEQVLQGVQALDAAQDAARGQGHVRSPGYGRHSVRVELVVL